MNPTRKLTLADAFASRCGALRAAGAGLGLLACVCMAAAHESEAAAQEDRPLLAMRGDEAAARITQEVADERSLGPASATPRVYLEGRATGDWPGAGVRLWLSSGRAAFGVGIVARGPLPPSPAAPSDGSNAAAGPALNLTLGVRYRMSNEHSVFADAYGAHGAHTDYGTALGTSRFGVDWKPAKAKFGFERGAFGLRLDSGYRLTLRARRGGAAVYLRGQF